MPSADAPHPLTIGVPCETCPGERRVALTPKSVAQLQKGGLEVLVQATAGEEAGFPDEEYAKQGATLVAERGDVFSRADVILQVRAAGSNPEGAAADLELFRDGQALIGMLDPLTDPQAIAAISAKGTSCFALELVPRISRAQSMDVLSSMATVAGYKAVLLAAVNLPRMFPMMMTAAGTITPAKVLVIGAGVAGLQAISTARRLGGVVQAYDIRPDVKEQIESLGARFVELPLEIGEAEQAGGYARQMDEEFYRKQQELLAGVIAECDVVVTTAAVPGKKAPILVTEEMVHGMAPGSILVDVAAERGGNCALTQPGETVVTGGVTILGPLTLPASIPYHASQMYSRNVTTFLLNMVQDGQLAIDTDDEIVSGTLVAQAGEVPHPRVREALGLPPRGDAAPAETES